MSCDQSAPPNLPLNVELSTQTENSAMHALLRMKEYCILHLQIVQQMRWFSFVEESRPHLHHLYPLGRAGTGYHSTQITGSSTCSFVTQMELGFRRKGAAGASLT